MSRRRGPGSIAEYGQMARRVVRGFVRRFEDEGDLDDLRMFHEIIEETEASMALAVSHLRARGNSWREIGEALGMTGENARQRWSEPIDDLPWVSAIYGLRGDDGEYRYVGQTVGLPMRIASYRAGRAHSATLRSWIESVGRGFQVDILEECAPRDLDAAEAKWIDSLRTSGHRLLNVNAAPTLWPRSTRERTTCPNTEMRWVPDRRVPPVEVRCTREVAHAGPCRRHGIPFGHQPAESAYSRYMARQGVTVTLARQSSMRSS